MTRWPIIDIAITLVVALPLIIIIILSLDWTIDKVIFNWRSRRDCVVTEKENKKLQNRVNELQEKSIYNYNLWAAANKRQSEIDKAMLRLRQYSDLEHNETLLEYADRKHKEYNSFTTRQKRKEDKINGND